MKTIITLWLLISSMGRIFSQDQEFEKLYKDWSSGYQALSIPATELDYSANFKNINSSSELITQAKFFNDYKSKINAFKQSKLLPENGIKLKQVQFEIQQNLERIRLQVMWNKGDKRIPTGGLHNLSNYKDWYSYYVRHFTGTNISVEDVFKTGQEEVRRAKLEIEKIKKSMGHTSDEDFYKRLNEERFFLTSKQKIIEGFGKIDSTVRRNLKSCFKTYTIPPIEAIEWPGATASTPPGMYVSKRDNPYLVDVFEFNFSTGRYNTRCMAWLYMHEAIPGHHLQNQFQIDDDRYYFGTSEGWACYVEDLGEELGVFKDVHSLLGKQEWNLVRSARLVMETGIHYYGWTYNEALRYWNENIKNQDDIAAREINRITKWPGQALCYKIGALTIKKIITNLQTKGMSLKDAHDFILQHSSFPLEALSTN